MAMPSGLDGIGPEAGSGTLNTDACGFMLMSHIGALSEPSALAFGKETKCPAAIQENSLFAMQISPSFSALFRLNPSHRIKANEGQ